MISNGYGMIKWGIILSVIHIYLLGSFEILPAFIGYFLIMKGMSTICDEINLDYMLELKAQSRQLFIFSVIYWIAGIFLGYQIILSKLILAIFYLFDILFFGNLLNRTVKYLKEHNQINEADKLRKVRLTFVKAYLALIIFCIITAVPNVLSALHIGSEAFINILSTILQYIFISLMLMLKLWLSTIIQRYSTN